MTPTPLSERIAWHLELRGRYIRFLPADDLEQIAAVRAAGRAAGRALGVRVVTTAASPGAIPDDTVVVTVSVTS